MVHAPHSPTDRRPRSWRKWGVGGATSEFVKSLLFPALLAVLGFGLGQLTSRLGEAAAADRATKESRSKLLVASGASFAQYSVNWSRLRTVAEAEADLVAEIESKSRVKAPAAATTQPGLAATSELERLRLNLSQVRTRKDKYVAARDAAKDELLRHLEGARIFFSEDVARKIELYETFDQGTAIKRLRDLPPMEEWRRQFTPVLRQMQAEVRKDET